jgi:hypothetical protein
MKFLIQGIIVVMIVAATSFGGCKEDLDNAIARVNDEQMMNRKLKDEIKIIKDETASAKKEKEAAMKEKEAAVKQADDLKAKNSDLEKKNKELSTNASQYDANAGTLQTLANDNNRLATENQELKNKLATMSTAVAAPVAPVDKFMYPISGIVDKKSSAGNQVNTYFIFQNNGSKTINFFDCVLKFYYQGRKFYEISLSNVKSQANVTFGRNESINYAAGLPKTDESSFKILESASPESIDLVVEVTKIH